MSPRPAGPRVQPPVEVPAPPDDPADLDPLIVTWAAGRPLHRCYDVAWGAREFHAGRLGRPGRFHPVRPPGADHDVPVLYAADDPLGALSETVFHDVPVRGTKAVPHAKLRHRLILELAPRRDLRLVDLTTDGLRRLGLSRLELIESDARSYPRTAAWAAALHRSADPVDGLLWVSRQRDTSQALMLYGDRVAVDDMSVPDTAIPLPLAVGSGLELVCAAADRAGITITGLPA